MKVLGGIILAVIAAMIMRVIVAGMLAKRNSKKVWAMAKELDLKKIKNYANGFDGYQEMLEFYKKNYADVYMIAESLAYVVMKHEIIPYRGDVNMFKQDRRMQICHRLVLENVVGTYNEKFILENPIYKQYCYNLGSLYLRYRNMNKMRKPIFEDAAFMRTDLPLAFLEICNEIYGIGLGL